MDRGRTTPRPPAPPATPLGGRLTSCPCPSHRQQAAGGARGLPQEPDGTRTPVGDAPATKEGR